MLLLETDLTEVRCRFDVRNRVVMEVCGMQIEVNLGAKALWSELLGLRRLVKALPSELYLTHV